MNAFGILVRIAFVAWSLFCIWKGCGQVLEVTDTEVVGELERQREGLEGTGALIAWTIIWIVPAVIMALVYGVLGRSRAT